MQISRKAYDAIVREEVGSKARYERLYRGPIWPQHSSGVTIGVGYDVGYVTPAKLRRDWGGRIPGEMIEALVPACGVKGPAAKPIAARLKGKVVVPWDAAILVFETVKVPEFEALTRRAFPNCDELPADCFGALVSLVFNRGTAMSGRTEAEKKRRREMRAIRDLMAARRFTEVPDQFRAMKWIWPGKNGAGLRGRRDREAKLFEDGLKSLVVRLASDPEIEPDYPTNDREFDDALPVSAAAPASDEVKQVQDDLRSLGYFAVGMPDGDLAGQTKGQIVAFRTDRGLPESTEIDDELKLEIVKAKAAGWRRPVADARANATPKEIAAQNETVKAAGQSRLAALWLTITSFFGALFKGAMEHVESAKEYLDQAKVILGDIPLEYYLAGLCVITFFIWRASARAQADAVKGFKEGRVL